MATKKIIERRTELSANIVAFCRYLRTQKYNIGPAEEADALKAIETLNPFANPQNFQLVLQAVLAKTRKQQLQFERLFQKYWSELEKALDAKSKDVEEAKPKSAQNKQKAFLALKNWLHGNKPPKEETSIATYSTQEVVTTRDFSTFSEAEMAEVARLVKEIAKKLARQYSRRKKQSKKKNYLDIKRTLRLNLRRGGEILDLAYSQPKKNKWQIVLLCDVSQSMELYSRFLIQFMYGFQNAYRNIETFVFSTHLTRVSKELKDDNYEEALENIGKKVTNWSGGTKIGESLYDFVRSYGSKILNKKSIILIMSDGWDTGDLDLLESSMRVIQKKSSKVIWLNPLAGNPQYSPEVGGMQTAMPYIDVFAPGHNLDSLKNIVRHLK